ncbi:MAG: hypothetical protein IT376_06980 [Polyangiaceae bacterium]|nr:hypothetical protein [Polyangiaceae bacterium]
MIPRLVAWLTLALGLMAGHARAETQTDLVRAAERAERALRFREALGAWREAASAEPGTRLGARARARAEYLAARQEGDFAPLVALEQMRRRPQGEVRAPLVEAFTEEVEAMPRGRVRVEARGVVAEAWLRSLKEPRRAVTAFEAWIAEPGIESGEEKLAVLGLAQARAELGEYSASFELLREAGLDRLIVASRLRVASVRGWATPLAIAAIAGFIAAGLWLGGRRLLRRATWTRAFAPARLAVGAWALGVPLALAWLHRYETWRGLSLALPLMAALLAGASVFGAALGAAAPPRRYGLGLSVLGVAAQVGAFYLGLDSRDGLVPLALALRLV